MGTDRLYHFDRAGVDKTSEELSAEVLKTLRSFVTDEAVNAVVITVPAKFTVIQKTATLEAARLAGFEQCELLQEPIAASYAFGLNSEQKNGTWMTFDFGGGTFDAALLKVEDGIIDVFDTAGDNYLGGKDLDEAIVDKVILPRLQTEYDLNGILNDPERNIIFREALKTYAEEAKIQLSFKKSEELVSNLGELGEDCSGEEMELYLTITRDDIDKAMRPVFRKAVDICKELLRRNRLSGKDLSRVILVGGPTRCPLIRQMLRDEISEHIDSSVDPMTAVATGAALYASTLDVTVKESSRQESDDVKLELNYEPTTVEDVEWVTLKLPAESSLNCLQVEIMRADGAWSSGKVTIDRQGDIVELLLRENKSNSFDIAAFLPNGDRVQCSPSQFSILHGTRVGAAPLPYNIGIATWSSEKKIAILKPIRGLEKNKPLPATGAINGLRTTADLRPGIENDAFVIPVYQCEDQMQIDRAADYYELVGEVRVSGDELPSMLPQGRTVDITIKVDSSEQMSLEIYIAALDLTITKQLDTGRKQSMEAAKVQIEKILKQSQNTIDVLRDRGEDVARHQREIAALSAQNANSEEKKAILQHLKELMRRLDDLDRESGWRDVERRLDKMLNELHLATITSDRPGEAKEIYASFKARVEQEKLRHNVVAANDLIEEMDDAEYDLTRRQKYIDFIKSVHLNFRYENWIDDEEARVAVDEAMTKISQCVTLQEMTPSVMRVWHLMKHESGGSVDNDIDANLSANGLLQ